jgi:DNA-binding CsgD family transcriptional regulator
MLPAAGYQRKLALSGRCMYRFVEQLATRRMNAGDHRTDEEEGCILAQSATELARKRDAASWVNWRSALYLFVLGMICVFLAPLTSFWWILPVFGVAAPLALVLLDRTGHLRKNPDDRKLKERELLEALVELGELTPTAVAMKTSLTVGEAAKMLEDLAGKGHLVLRTESGTAAYALRQRDRRDPAEAGRSPQALDEPLSERELEVLNMLASGRTNSEIARELFISLGTVKSHTGNIYRKLGVKNRAEALARARQLGVLP